MCSRQIQRPFRIPPAPPSLCGPPLPEQRPPRSWLRAILPRLRVAAAIFRTDGPFGPHATQQTRTAVRGK